MKVFYKRIRNLILQGNLNDMKQNLTFIAGRLSKLERRKKKNEHSLGSAAAKAGKTFLYFTVTVRLTTQVAQLYV